MRADAGSETLLRGLAVLGGLIIVALGSLLWVRWNEPGVLPMGPEGGPAPGVDGAVPLRSDAPRELPDAQPGAASPVSPQVSPQVSAMGAPEIGVVLYGLVTDAEGNPIERARLTVGDLRRTTRATGYSIAGLQPGTVQLTCTAPGYDDLERTIELSVSPATQRLDLVLRKATILAVKILTPDGEPLYEVLDEAIQDGRFERGVRVTALATREAPLGHFPPTILRSLTDFGVGTWRDGQGSLALIRGEALPREYAGQLQLSVDLPVHVSAVLRHHVLATELVSPGQEEVTLTVPFSAVEGSLGSLRVTFVDATGAPLEGVRVDVSDSQSGGQGVPTDHTGSTRIEGLRPGLLEMRARLDDYATVRTQLRIRAGQELQLGVLQMHGPHDLSGSIIDPDGQRTAARISARRLDPVVPGQPIGRPTGGNSTASEGFQLSLAPARYVLRALSSELSRGHALVDLTQGPVEDIRLQLAPTVPVDVQCDFSEVEVYEVSILDPQGIPAWDGRIPRLEGYRIDLVPGAYTVRARDSAGLVTEKRLTVTENGGTIVLP